MEKYHVPDIKIMRCDYRYGITMWDHRNIFNSYWCLYWNNTAGAIISTSDFEHQLKPTEFCLIAPETLFSTKLKLPFNHFFLHFTAGVPFDQIKSKIYFFSADEIVMKQIEMIRSLIPSQAVLGSVHLGLLAHSVICSMLLKIKDSEFKRLKRCSPLIEDALDTLNKKTSTIVPNEELAANAGMSVNGFIRLFAKELGITPQKYSRRKRIEKASILLHLTNKSLDDIATETGFLDRYHFSRAFKETTNYSPAEFRKRQISF